jgi:hypothetical protein
MARLFSDENFPESAVRALRKLGHEVVTAAAAGLASKRVPDEIVLEYATRLGHAVVTYNRQDFILLHDRQPNHAGIIVCHAESDTIALAERIDQSIRAATQLKGTLIQVPA